MASSKDQRTEKPTEQRLRKAREEGRFPSSREFPFALQWFVFTLLVTGYFPGWARDFATWAASIWRRAGQAGAGAELPSLSGLLPVFWPLLAAGGLVWLAGLSAHLMTTGFGFATAKLAPDLTRLNPGSKLSEMPSQNLGNFIQTVILLPLMTLLLVATISGHAATLLPLARYRVTASLPVWLGVLNDVIWKAAWVFFLYGAWDFVRQRRKWMDGLKMSRQEIRDEWKQQEGSPEIKMRIRRIRRDLLRRRMMSEVPNATAVIVNPTHFAVALRYQPGQSAAPKVVAKGKNYLALRIRELARKNQVPVIENPPLAQALYKSVEVGQEIPAHLYRAVAEILAYLYRILNGRLPG
jgi:flagellar biosynthesis protein FlhB